MPPALERAWHTHGYYGSVSHNVKAIYQRYLGWYDGNPAHLWQHPPQETARRYVQLFGGVDATVQHARDFAERGDFRFAAELASHAVFADDQHAGARGTLAYVLERLGYGAECATWRNCYLSGAYELRHGIQPEPAVTTGLAAAMTTTQLFDSIALRIDGKRAWNEQISISWQFTDSGDRYHMELSNGALIHYLTQQSAAADLTITLTRQDLFRILATGTVEGIAHTGDPAVMQRLLALTASPNPDFPIVTP
jgi:linear primary-alkylsulfatase